LLPPCPEDTGVLPPPEKLKNKILIKGKRLPKSSEPELPEEDLEEEEEAEPKEGKPEDVKSSQKTEKPEKKKKEKTAKELSDITHLKTYGLTSFKENRGNNLFRNFSFS
jgi:hypothetical protein